MRNNINPVVSIVCIAYNQEKYISHCIDGFLMQKVSFQIEILIHDDASTDGTADIIREYQNKYSNLIFPVFQKVNQWSIGVNPGVEFLFPKCKGKYIAICEGDDYWTDPYKLQKQVDFLEANEEFSGCFHDVVTVNEKSEVINKNYYDSKLSSYNQEQALKILQSSQATCSMLFRSLVVKRKLPNWFVGNACDFTLDLLITEYGLLGYIPQNMGAYRIHSAGIWQGSSYLFNRKSHLDRFLKLYSDLSFRSKYRSYIIDVISFMLLEIIEISNKENDVPTLRKYMTLYFRYKRTIKPFTVNYIIKYVYLPRTYRIVYNIIKGNRL